MRQSEPKWNWLKDKSKTMMSSKQKSPELINTKRAQIIMEAQEEAYKEAVLNLEKRSE